MSEQIYLKEYRTAVDKKYVGFTPNGDSIKAVHIADGSLRCIFGQYNTTKKIKRLALVSDTKGNIPKGNDDDSIYTLLKEEDKIEDSVEKNSVSSMRNLMQKLLSADKGVFVLKDLGESMLSYTAGSKYFLTKGAMYEDAGEFIGSVIKEYCPELTSHIKSLLEDSKDPITLLFEPVLANDSFELTEKNVHEDIPAFKKKGRNMQWYIEGLKESSKCLAVSLRRHPNSLTQLRIFNFFCIFQLVRYMTMLEAFYCNESIWPIFLDFSGKAPSQSSIARASEMSYTQIYKSINRFYAWGYAQNLKRFTKKELLDFTTPIYEKNKALSKSSKEELKALWDNVQKRVRKLKKDDDIRLTLGETIYDLLALEASSYPLNFLKKLGTSAGMLYPPDRMHTKKRFALSQDMIEMILRSCVEPKEVIDSSVLRRRLWERFGIVVGGSTFEIEKIRNTSMLIQLDETALEENFSSFEKTLEMMDFAETMADGILQIRLGGID